MSIKGRYRNNKTGVVYLHRGTAIDATNSRDGTVVVLYQSADDPTRVYVRDAREFDQMFTRIPDGPKKRGPYRQRNHSMDQRIQAALVTGPKTARHLAELTKWSDSRVCNTMSRLAAKGMVVRFKARFETISGWKLVYQYQLPTKVAP